MTSSHVSDKVQKRPFFNISHTSLKNIFLPTHFQDTVAKHLNNGETFGGTYMNCVLIPCWQKQKREFESQEVQRGSLSLWELHTTDPIPIPAFPLGQFIAFYFKMTTSTQNVWPGLSALTDIYGSSVFMFFWTSAADLMARKETNISFLLTE